MSTLFGKSSELSALIRVRDEDQARWLAVVERVGALGTKNIAEFQRVWCGMASNRY
jgi:hypothetical protein